MNNISLDNSFPSKKMTSDWPCPFSNFGPFCHQSYHFDCVNNWNLMSLQHSQAQPYMNALALFLLFKLLICGASHRVKYHSVLMWLSHRKIDCVEKFINYFKSNKAIAKIVKRTNPQRPQISLINKKKR